MVVQSVCGEAAPAAEAWRDSAECVAACAYYDGGCNWQVSSRGAACGGQHGLCGRHAHQVASAQAQAAADQPGAEPTDPKAQAQQRKMDKMAKDVAQKQIKAKKAELDMLKKQLQSMK